MTYNCPSLKQNTNKNILTEMRWKIFERQQQKPWFQQLDWLLFLSLTIDNSKKYAINPTYYNESIGHRVSMNVAINMRGEGHFAI